MTAFDIYRASLGRYYWRLALDASRHGKPAEAVAYRHLALGDSVETSLAAAAKRETAYLQTGH